MRITGTFLDEISYDIPHQNWGPKEWRKDFQAMKAVGIDTVILIRCGLERFIAYPSDYLIEQVGCYRPPVDLVELFLTLADEFQMAFYFGTYDPKHSAPERIPKILDINLHVIDEAWKRYSAHPSFKGWYLSMEFCRSRMDIVEMDNSLGRHAKALSGNLPVMISPYIDGKKAVGNNGALTKEDYVTVEQHFREWKDMLAGAQGAIDTVAFQDGHCEYDELSEFLEANKKLTDLYGMHSWTNCESFDRDMPIRFLPIKWEKMRLKLEAAQKAGLEKAITFEFSHFMSPNSMYPTAAHLYERYSEYVREVPTASSPSQMQ